MSESYREDKNVELLLIGEREKKEYVLIKDSKLLMLCIIIHFIVEQKLFVVIVYRLLEKQT